MSGWGDMAKDDARARWLNKWVPRDDDALDECPEAFLEQHRYTLARARHAEHDLKELRETLRRLWRGIKEAA